MSLGMRVRIADTQKASADPRAAGASVIAYPGHAIALAGELVSIGLPLHPARPSLAELTGRDPPFASGMRFLRVQLGLPPPPYRPPCCHPGNSGWEARTRKFEHRRSCRSPPCGAHHPKATQAR